MFASCKPYYENDFGALYYGDCLEIMPLLCCKVDLVLTDPPFGTTSCEWDKAIPLKRMWDNIKRVRRANTPIVLFGSEPYSSYVRLSNIKEFKYDWIWDKVGSVGFLNCNKAPLRRHEVLSVFCGGSIPYYPIMEVRGKERVKGGGSFNGGVYREHILVSSFNNTYYPTDILTFSNASHVGKLHPTQKPVELMEYLIKTYTNDGDTVLDFTSGSGTTGIACMNTGRKFIMIEKSKEYCDISVKRLSEAFGRIIGG